MKFKLLFLFVFPTLLFSQVIHERNLMMKEFNKGYLKESLIPHDQFHPYPTIQNRDFWKDISDDKKKIYIAEAETYLNKDWTFLPATDYLMFAQDGNRSVFESKNFSRWGRLNCEVIAELIENRGRFTNDIINGVWSICEESSWCWPAHIGAQKAGSGLPDVTEPVVDLGVGEMSCKMAWISYLMGSKLDSISPLVSKRINFEVHKRFLEPLLQRDDFGWANKKAPNNWAPWIISNYLACVLLLETDQNIQLKEIEKSCRILDKFINGYADDGGCDEGPSYYSHAGACMFDCLDLLSMATHDKFNVYRETVIKNMASYIIKAHISDSYYTNFADASAIMDYKIYKTLLYEFGKKTGNEDMQHFAAYLNSQKEEKDPDIRFYFGHRFLRDMMYEKEVAKTEPRAPFYKNVWFEGIQVMIARSEGGTSKGLCLAAQGGNNDESHNHNDVGNFIVYKDGAPALIDVGVGVYTRKTFSAERYTIWTMQSQYHNCPTINGAMQSPGLDCKAQQVVYNESKNTSLTMNISAAYPKEAEVQKWTRTFLMNRSKKCIELTDDYELSKYISASTLDFMCLNEPVVAKPGLLSVVDKNNSGIDIVFNPIQFEVSVEPIDIDDPHLLKAWGNRIYRIRFKITDHSLKNKTVLSVIGHEK